MSLAAVPGIEQIGETIIGEARDRMDDGKGERPPKPDIAGSSQPDCDRTIGPEMQSTFGVDGMQAAANVFHAGAEAGERIGLEIDVAKFDRAGFGRAHEAATLPVDAGVADRAFGVVPDGEFGMRGGCRHDRAWKTITSSLLCRFANSLIGPPTRRRLMRDKGFDRFIDPTDFAIEPLFAWRQFFHPRDLCQ
jgi:hypothetical protein